MKKIMFNDSVKLTQSVIELRKTNTRRICKNNATGEIIYAKNVDSYRFYPEENIVEFVMKNGDIVVSVPPYKVGEIVAVAQSYKRFCTDFETLNEVKCMCGRDVTQDKSWNNKMFVQALRMPHRIKFTGLNFEGLQDISDEDCLKEGIIKEFNDDNTHGWHWDKDALPFDDTFQTCREAFSALIDKVSGKGTWDSNPLVFAYEFELIK